MRKHAMSRRMLLETGVFALAVTGIVPKIGSAHAVAGLNPQSEQTIRKYYAAWGTKAWQPIDVLLADNFTFTSPNDDHISKSVFKTRCWEPNVSLIEHIDLQEVVGRDNDAFVMYVCHIKGGKALQNVEHLQVRDGRVETLRCYFGGRDSYPSAVVRQK